MGLGDVYITFHDITTQDSYRFVLHTFHISISHWVQLTSQSIILIHNWRLREINRRRSPPIGKLVFRVRVVRGSEQARRSCVGV